MTLQIKPLQRVIISSLSSHDECTFFSIWEKVLDLWFLEMRGSKSYFQCFIGYCSCFLNHLLVFKTSEISGSVIVSVREVWVKL